MKYKPRNHGANRMSHEGDVERARKLFYNKNSKNLKFLVEKRFFWMNDFIDQDQFGVEVGCGTGISKDFINCKNYKVSDFSDSSWLDYKNVDALNTGFKSNQFDFVISSNMIHHVPYPILFFKEMRRIIKPGGKLIIQEINCSTIMRFILKVMRHEGYDFTIDVFDEKLICTDPEDLWSANCAIPNLLFDNEEKFKSHISGFDFIHQGYSEFSIFLNSGGVISKTIYIPLNNFFLKILNLIDELFVAVFPKIFALQRQIVLIKK